MLIKILLVGAFVAMLVYFLRSGTQHPGERLDADSPGCLRHRGDRCRAVSR